MVNLAPGTLKRGKGKRVPLSVSRSLRKVPHEIEHHSFYSLTAVDNLTVPLGALGEVFAIDHVANGFRELALHFMRKNQSGTFRRWHSPELARRAYGMLE